MSLADDRRAHFETRIRTWPDGYHYRNEPTPELPSAWARYAALWDAHPRPHNPNGWMPLRNPMFVTISCREQLLDMIMDGDWWADWRDAHDVADRDDADALIGPAGFEDYSTEGFEDYLVDHPSASWQDYLVASMRGDDVLGWQEGDPQP